MTLRELLPSIAPGQRVTIQSRFKYPREKTYAQGRINDKTMNKLKDILDNNVLEIYMAYSVIAVFDAICIVIDEDFIQTDYIE